MPECGRHSSLRNWGPGKATVFATIEKAHQMKKILLATALIFAVSPAFAHAGFGVGHTSSNSAAASVGHAAAFGTGAAIGAGVSANGNAASIGAATSSSGAASVGNGAAAGSNSATGVGAAAGF